MLCLIVMAAIDVRPKAKVDRFVRRRSVIAIEQRDLGKDEPGEKGQLVAPGDSIKQAMHLHVHQRRQTTGRQRPVLLPGALQPTQPAQKTSRADRHTDFRRRREGVTVPSGAQRRHRGLGRTGAPQHSNDQGEHGKRAGCILTCNPPKRVGGSQFGATNALAGLSNPAIRWWI